MSYKQALALSLLTLSACGTPDGLIVAPPTLPLAYQQSDLKVFSSEPLDADSVRYTLALEIYYTRGIGGEFADFTDFGNANVYMMSVPPTVEGNQVGGVTYPTQNLIEVNYYDTSCIGQNALQHELSHWIRYSVLGDADAEHKDTRFFSSDGHSDLTIEVAHMQFNYCKAAQTEKAYMLDAILSAIN